MPNAGWQPGPQFKIRPPVRGLGSLQRPRLEDALSVSAEAHRLTLVAAPAGYGKSTFLGDWVRGCSLPCAWLSLDRFDTEPARLFHGVVAALRRAAGTLPLPGSDSLLALDRSLAPGRAASYDLLLSALEELTEPIVLVIDDVHLAGAGLANGIVGVLAASAPPSLRLVLSGRGRLAVQRERLRYGEGLGEFRAPELAFTLQEVTQVAASRGQGASFDAAGLWTMTAGWPVAVHAGLVSLAQTRSVPVMTPQAPATHMRLADYVAEEVLNQLEPSVAEFILRATTCNWLDRRLAAELSGSPHGGALLEECLRDGLFLEEHAYPGREALYLWQPVFAAQCQGILERRDPLLFERLHRVAARYCQDSDVAGCVAHALKGRAPRQAVTALGARWLDFVAGHDVSSLERLCRDLPAPWAEDPEILMVSSVCRALSGDSDAASGLTLRALSRTVVLDAQRRRRFASCRARFGPAPAVGRPGSDAAAVNVGQPVRGPSARSAPAAGSTALSLLARAEFRLHRTGELALTVLAGGAGNPDQSEGMEAWTQAELAVASAAAGDLGRASEDATRALELGDARGRGLQERTAPAWLARGIVSYWNNNLTAAQTYLAEAQRLGSELAPAGPLGIIYRVLTGCAAGGPAQLAGSAALLESMDARGLYSVPWGALRTIALAKTAEARGDLDGALAIVRPLGTGIHGALADALLAELLRRGGEITAALRCATQLADRRGNPCVDTCTSLTEALIAYGTGDTATAHERIEHALHRARPGSILRPFAERREELSELLGEHAVWGSAHGSFLAALMACETQGPGRPRTQPCWTLTQREREVLVYMRSIMTAAEIAEALYISVNTVKTHERSIYRKLGAASRRDALKRAAKRGIV